MSAAKHKLKFDRRKVDELRRLVDEVGDIHDYRRLMAVWIRAIADLPAGKIAEMLRMKTQTVRQLQSTCHAEGAQALVGRPGRGGRRSVNMSYDNELKLLDKVTVKVEGLREKAVLLEPLMNEYRKQAGTVSPRSTIYRMLARHRCYRIRKGVYSKPPKI